MVRGTNKRIIEINDTQNPYFERAVLYLTDTQADSSKKMLETQAQNFLCGLRSPFLRGAKPSFLCSVHGRRCLSACKLLLSAAVGGGVTFLMIH